MTAYKVIYGAADDTHEVYKLKFQDAKAMYFKYKKHYMSFKDTESYTEERHLKGMFKDFWSLSAVIGATEDVIKIAPIEIN